MKPPTPADEKQLRLDNMKIEWILHSAVILVRLRPDSGQTFLKDFYGIVVTRCNHSGNKTNNLLFFQPVRACPAGKVRQASQFHLFLECLQDPEAGIARGEQTAVPTGVESIKKYWTLIKEIAARANSRPQHLKVFWYPYTQR